MNFMTGTVERHEGQVVVRVGDGEDAVRLRVAGGGADGGDGGDGFVGLEDGRAVELGVRPHDVRMHADGDGQDHGQDHGGLRMGVELVETLGPDAHVHGKVGGKAFVASLPGSQPVARGERIGLRVTELHLFDAETGVSLRG